MAAKTVQPPRFMPAICPSSAPKKPWTMGSRMPNPIKKGPTFFKSARRPPATSPISKRKMHSAPRKIMPLL